MGISVALAVAILSFAGVLIVAIIHQAPIASYAWDAYLADLLWFTLFQAALSTLLSVGAGVLLARALYYTPSFPLRRGYIALFSTALVLPVISVILGMVSLYGANGYLTRLLRTLFGFDTGGYLYGLGGILLAHVFLNASYTARAYWQRYGAIPLERFKTAASLDMGAWQRFWCIEWPALKKTIASTAITVFLLCFSSFTVILVFGASPRYNTLEIAIYQAVKFDFDIPEAMRLASVHLAVAFAAVVLGTFVASDQSSGSATNGNGADFFRSYAERRRHFGVLAVAGLFFFLPLGALVWDGLRAPLGDIIRNDTFLAATCVSFISAGISAFLVPPLAYALAYGVQASRRYKRRKLALGARLIVALAANVYMAVPTLIIALGFFLLAMRSSIDTVWWAYIALIGANVFAALPFAFHLYDPLLQTARLRYDRLSRMLGLSAWEDFRIVQWPFLRQATGYVAALSFCFALGDMGVIALFGSDTFQTLPWYVYGLMGSYRMDEAAGVGLLLLSVSVAAFVLIPWIIGGRDATR